jgi:hypothetical protein
MLTDDGGRIYDTPEGLVFTSPGYSTSDQKVIREIIEEQKKKGGKTPKEMAESRIRQDILGQAPIASRGAAAIQGLPFVGEYVDELIGLASPRIQQNVRAAQSTPEALLRMTNLRKKYAEKVIEKYNTAVNKGQFEYMGENFQNRFAPIDYTPSYLLSRPSGVPESTWSKMSEREKRQAVELFSNGAN